MNNVSFSIRPAALLLVVACAPEPPTPTEARVLIIVGEDATDVPLRLASQQQRDTFDAGDAIFETPLRASQGLGPVYIRRSCGACHAQGMRGTGRVQKMVVVEADGVTPTVDQSLVFDVTVRPFTTGDAAPVVAPGDASVHVTTRLPPAVVGRGYMEAVRDSEIERIAAEQAMRDDGIHGRINYVSYDSALNPGGGFHNYEPGEGGLIGRFGLKATVPAIDAFAARALLLDIGITSPLQPTELPNPSGATDDDKLGVDVDTQTVTTLATYVRLLEIPRRDASHTRGRTLFEQVKCAVCHVPSLRTRDDYPISALAGIDAEVYTDFLLHERGPAYDDSVVEGDASASQWRTAPLIGLRFMQSYLHDGSAHSIEEAVASHAAPGSQSSVAAALFDALPAQDQAELLDFVKSL